MILPKLRDKEHNYNAEVRKKIERAKPDQQIKNFQNELNKTRSPLKIINQLLHNANIQIKLELKNGYLYASKSSSSFYVVTELSDGERNIFLIAAAILTAPKDMLLLIDGPDRHLHCSISSLFFTELFKERPDCNFVIVTYDDNLPRKCPQSQNLHLRSCQFEGKVPFSWEGDLQPSQVEVDIDKSSIDNSVKRRKPNLFVEGGELSLDKKLYSIIFPHAMVHATKTCSEIETKVKAYNDDKKQQESYAFGIVDGDRLSVEDKKNKKENNIYVLPYYSIEAIYVLPEVMKCVAQKQYEKTNTSYCAWNHLYQKAFEVVRKFMAADCNDAVKKLAKNQYSEGDWEKTLKNILLKKHKVINEIADKFKLQGADDYYELVNSIISKDNSLLKLVRGLFDDLYYKIYQIQQKS